ncbi:MAG: S24/S26 family peptidase [Clostridia bacterium]|nr:S24/S26 family peptidase [Clostridia bacterium]
MNNELSVEEVLEQKGVWVSTVQGGSMMPMLRQGQDVIVVEKPPQKINKYDVVLIRKNGKLVLHRIAKVYKNGYLFVGDNAFYKEKIFYSQIIGVLKEFYKGDKLVSVQDKKYRRYAFFRVKTYYLRLFWFRLKRLFKKG